MNSIPSFNRWASLLFLSAALGLTVQKAVAGNTVDMVLIPAGNYGGTARSSPRIDLKAFYIRQYEETWGIFQQVRDWAVKNGYPDLANKGAGRGPNHPVTNVNWYDAVKWCNAYSELSGLTPVYRVNGQIYRTGEAGLSVTADGRVNGYRLPIENEWKVAFAGADRKRPYTFSGSNNANEVAWHNKNSSKTSHQVGLKRGNKLRIFDMSGNVEEWVEDNSVTYVWSVPINDSRRLCLGGSWFSSPGAWVGYPFTQPGELTGNAIDAATISGSRSTSRGFRVVRTK
jgi:formylglycine-generating enzyme required for sulfatase activity